MTFHQLLLLLVHSIASSSSLFGHPPWRDHSLLLWEKVQGLPRSVVARLSNPTKMQNVSHSHQCGRSTFYGPFSGPWSTETPWPPTQEPHVPFDPLFNFEARRWLAGAIMTRSQCILRLIFHFFNLRKMTVQICLFRATTNNRPVNNRPSFLPQVLNQMTHPNDHSLRYSQFNLTIRMKRVLEMYSPFWVPRIFGQKRIFSLRFPITQWNAMLKEWLVLGRLFPSFQEYL